MSKSVFVVLSDYPLGTNRTSEKLRMALGLTLNDDNAVSLVFLGKARHALAELDEPAAGMQPVNKHVAMLARLKASFYVEAGGAFPMLKEIKPVFIQPSEVDMLLDKADVLIH